MKQRKCACLLNVIYFHCLFLIADDDEEDTEEVGQDHSEPVASTKSSHNSPELLSKKSRHDIPVRKTRHDSPEVSPPRRGRHDSPDRSPPRKHTGKSGKVLSKGE